MFWWTETSHIMRSRMLRPDDEPPSWPISAAICTFLLHLPATNPFIAGKATVRSTAILGLWDTALCEMARRAATGLIPDRGLHLMVHGQRWSEASWPLA